jgi:DNA-binding transcriptional regulator LsrR (DeoR family)
VARESEARGPAWQVQAALIARRFYLEGRSKVEIADELGLSRFKVARILDDARELGLVEVTIKVPTRIYADLSSQLASRMGVRRAIVVGHRAESNTALRDELGRVGADLLSELVTDDDTLGLTCSRTVTAATAALQHLATCTVVQLTGTLAGPDLQAGSVESVRRAAEVGGGKAYPIYAPMVLPDPATACALAGEPAIRQTLGAFDDVTIAMVAIGAWASGLSTVWSTVGPAERSAASAAGAVGEIGARLFDATGRSVDTPVGNRVLGVTLEQLRRVPEVIGLARDARRAGAVRAAVAGGIIDTLVCDAELGRALLDPSAQTHDAQGARA